MMLLMNKKGGIYMKKEENKVDFDLSVLSLEELIKVYENVDNFLKYLQGKKIIIEEKVVDKNE